LAAKVDLIFSCYRKDEAHNATTYAQAVMLVLSDFPRSVVDHVVDPRTGILGTSKWLPTVAEIKEACENAHHKICQDEEREQRIAKQLADREVANYISPLDEARRRAIADAWLNRTDAQAQALGQKPKALLTDEQKQALLDDARDVAKQINDGAFTLSSEARAILEEQEMLRDYDNAERS